LPQLFRKNGNLVKNAKLSLAFLLLGHFNEKNFPLDRCQSNLIRR